MTKMKSAINQTNDDSQKSSVDKEEVPLKGTIAPKIVMLPIKSLIHPKYNPRKISDKDFAQLKKSLEKFGTVQPAIINIHAGRQNIIVGGNQRIDAAKSLLWEEFPCIEVDLDEKNERELNIRLNRNGGDWDFNMLRDMFKADDLMDFGFDPKSDVKLRDFLVAEDDYSTLNDQSSEIVKEEHMEQFNPDSVYCACRQHTDIGRGICAHDCSYCFVRATPAGQGQTPGRYILASKRSLNDMVEDLEVKGWPLHVGACNDPAMPVFHPSLGYLLERATGRQLTVVIGTKNPAAIITGLTTFKIDWSYVTFKVAFSICKDEISAIIERGAPVVSKRIESAKVAADAGADLILRFAPFMVGYYEGMQDTMMAFAKMGCSRVICEPFRISATGRRYFERVGKGLYLDKNSLENYLERIANKENKFYGALHWHDYNKQMLREAYLTIKTMAKKAKLYFGICNAELGVEYMDLNEGEFCCQTKRMQEHEVKFDEYSIAALSSSGRIKELRMPIFDEPYFKDLNNYNLMFDRLGWINDRKVTYKVFDKQETGK